MASRLLFSCTLGKKTLGCTHTSARRRTRAHARTHTRPFAAGPSERSQQPAASSQQPLATHTFHTHTHTHTGTEKVALRNGSQQPAASSQQQHTNGQTYHQMLGQPKVLTTSLDLNGTVCEYTMVAKQKKAFRELWSPSSQVV